MKKTQDHLGFKISARELIGNVLIPKYYDPEIDLAINSLNTSHSVIRLGDLIDQDKITVTTGDEIGKMSYGTGDIPFIRTSDITNWEVKTDPKQGVSEAIYEEYSKKQDLKSGDILFVRDGTYLIGSCCIITDYDSKALFQSHILKFRVNKNSPITNTLLLALLSSPLVIAQIRSKQFTADIIDTIGNRFKELFLPIPNSSAKVKDIQKQVLNITQTRAQEREMLRKLPLLAQGLISALDEKIPETKIQEEIETRNLGFIFNSTEVSSNVFLPRYYDPIIEKQLQNLRQTHDLVSIQDLLENDIIEIETGIEVGKMAYGTGTVPFIRTSDISNWELKSDPKQNVSEEIYLETRVVQDVKPEDIFLVRDGTYLVGTSCIINKGDEKIIYCGGIYKIRVKKKDHIDPYLLLVLLNTPIVKKQIKAKQFTRDIIDTLGKRVVEILLPVPKNRSVREQIQKVARTVVQSRMQLRDQAKKISSSI